MGSGDPDQLRFSSRRDSGKARSVAGSDQQGEGTVMLYNEPSPLETRVLTRRFLLQNSASIDTYLATDGYKAFMKAVAMTPEDIINEVKTSSLRGRGDRKSTRLNSSHQIISYAVFCLKKKTK